MEDRDNINPQLSFLGTGWSFPPSFNPVLGQVSMTSDEEDIAASLKILLGTTAGERLFNPRYGLNLREYLFEPMTTGLKSLLLDKIKTNILIYEPRIKLLSLDLDATQELSGVLKFDLSYEVRATNSRFNLVYPFYITDSNEASGNLPVLEAIG